MTILTEEELESINNDLLDHGKGSRIDFARAIEAAVIEKIKARGAVAEGYFKDGRMFAFRLDDMAVVMRLPEGVSLSQLYRIED